MSAKIFNRLKKLFSIYRAKYYITTIILFLIQDNSYGLRSEPSPTLSKTHFDYKNCIDFTVLSYNIQHGQGLDGEINLARLAHEIKKFSPDFVALQEVDNGTHRSSYLNQAYELARLAGLKFYYFSPSINFNGGQYGIAILSNFEAKEIKTISLPSQKEPRIAFFANFYFKNSTINIINTHLDTSINSHIASFEKIENLTANLEGAVLLVGDLNTSRDSASLEILHKRYLINDKSSSLFTFPAQSPRKQIDFILPRFNPGFTWSANFFVPKGSTASDHLPILGTLNFCSTRKSRL